VPEISLLQPTVLNGFVRRKPFPQNLLGLALMGGRTGYPFPNWAYDIVQGNQLMSKPNVPNQEAHIRPQRGVGQVAGSFIYMRDKKVFTPTAIHWLRAPGELARSAAEAKVAEEVSDLDDSIERFVEWSVWQMLLTGTLIVNRPDAPRVNINYQIPSNLQYPSQRNGVEVADPDRQQYDCAACFPQQHHAVLSSLRKPEDPGFA
jgi:hypothetical protein